MRQAFISIFILIPFIGQSQQTVGIFQNDSLSFNGYTLFAPMSSFTTYLIDNCGNSVHQWESDYRPGAVAYLHEDGHLYRAGTLPSSFFNGGGKGGRIEEFDWDGNLVWSFEYATEEYHLHHDIEILPNGNILAISWDKHSIEEAIQLGKDPNTVLIQTWPDKIIELEKVGNSSANIVCEWKAWDHLVQDFDNSLPAFGAISEHPELLDINYPYTSANSDWMHCNAVDYNPDLDLIIISSHGLKEMWIIDHSTDAEEVQSHAGGNYGKGGDILYRFGNPAAYARGDEADQKFFQQHDVQWITEGLPYAGQILVFNNRGGAGFNSAVERFALPYDNEGVFDEIGLDPYGPEEFLWHYEAPDFFSMNISGVQMQSNGNLLICEGQTGRIFEIDEDQETHWTYKNPDGSTGPVSQGVNPPGSNVFRAYRYATDYPAFEGVLFDEPAPIELNPWEYECDIHGDSMTSGLDNEYTFAELRLANPFSTELSFNIEKYSSESYFKVWSSLGQIVHQGKIRDSAVSINTSEWRQGIYILQLTDIESQLSSSYRLIKL